MLVLLANSLTGSATISPALKLPSGANNEGFAGPKYARLQHQRWLSGRIKSKHKRQRSQ